MLKLDMDVNACIFDMDTNVPMVDEVTNLLNPDMGNNVFMVGIVRELYVLNRDDNVFRLAIVNKLHKLDMDNNGMAARKAAAVAAAVATTLPPAIAGCDCGFGGPRRQQLPHLTQSQVFLRFPLYARAPSSLVLRLTSNGAARRPPPPPPPPPLAITHFGEATAAAAAAAEDDNDNDREEGSRKKLHVSHLTRRSQLRKTASLSVSTVLYCCKYQVQGCAYNLWCAEMRASFFVPKVINKNLHKL